MLWRRGTGWPALAVLPWLAAGTGFACHPKSRIDGKGELTRLTNCIASRFVCWRVHWLTISSTSALRSMPASIIA
jgi:hypothetical protein